MRYDYSRYVMTLAKASMRWLPCLLLVGCSVNPSPPVTIPQSPLAWGFQYSPNMPLHPSGGNGLWFFDFPQADGAHYLVAPINGSLQGTLTAAWQVDLSGTFEWDTSNNKCPGPAHVALYLQRQGDDMVKPSYRFWSKFYPLATGSQSLQLIWQNWTNVDGQPDPTGFAQAIADPQAIGVTFGGGCFAGHGVWVNGAARFTMLKFRL